MNNWHNKLSVSHQLILRTRNTVEKQLKEQMYLNLGAVVLNQVVLGINSHTVFEYSKIHSSNIRRMCFE